MKIGLTACKQPKKPDIAQLVYSCIRVALKKYDKECNKCVVFVCRHIHQNTTKYFSMWGQAGNPCLCLCTWMWVTILLWVIINYSYNLASDQSKWNFDQSETQKERGGDNWHPNYLIM